jgi:hypothetical protein
MNESVLYETIGRATVERENLLREYRELLGLIVRIQRGEVDIGQVVVNMAANSWQIAPVAVIEPKGEGS